MSKRRPRAPRSAPAQEQAQTPDDNLAIWKQVETTDPRHTKKIPYGHRDLTSIKTLYNVKRATMIFGPAGTGWGWEILSDSLDKIGPCMLKNEQGYYPCGELIVHSVQLRMWFLQANGQRASIEQFGHTKVAYPNSDRNDIVYDYDYGKKSVSDAIKKCLSYLGFSADIYNGLFDDPEYKKQLAKVAAEQTAEEKAERDKQAAEALELKREEFRTYLLARPDAFKQCPNIKALDTRYHTSRDYVNQQLPLLQLGGQDQANTIHWLDARYFERLDELSSPQDTVCTECGIEGHQYVHRRCAECGTGKVIARKPAQTPATEKKAG